MRAILVVLLLAGVFVVIGSLLPWGDGRAWVPALAAGVTLVILAGVMLARSTDLYLWSLAVAGVAVLAAAWKWGALLEPGLRGPDGIGLAHRRAPRPSVAWPPWRAEPDTGSLVEHGGPSR